VNFLPAHRPARLSVIPLAAITAIVTTLALMISQQGSARATTARSVTATTSGAKPTIVLVHGVWADHDGYVMMEVFFADEIGDDFASLYGEVLSPDGRQTVGVVVARIAFTAHSE
jgi:hypothetical protein